MPSPVLSSVSDPSDDKVAALDCSVSDPELKDKDEDTNEEEDDDDDDLGQQSDIRVGGQVVRSIGHPHKIICTHGRKNLREHPPYIPHEGRNTL